MEKEISNKYNINEELYCYNQHDNMIMKIKVFSITYDKDHENLIRYNYIYTEDMLFDTYDDAFMFARICIKEHMEHLINELKEGDYDGRK